MPQILTIIFSAAIVILTVILAIVGVQLVLVLIQFRRTLRTVNRTMTDLENKINELLEHLQSLGGIATGVKTGVKVFETFVSWLNKKKKRKNEQRE
jgi:heme/copper-type cytochrome/quinol oxidase subunit 1